MTDIDNGALSGGADRFDAAEALLARYPHLDEVQLADLKQWYRKEASAFEVATLAGKDTTREGYRRFRADHIDGLSWRDLVTGAAIVAVVAGVVAGIGVLGT